MRCLLINQEGRVVNIIAFDGSAGDYTPPEGTTLVEYPEESHGTAHIGWWYHHEVDRVRPERPEE